MRHYFGYDVDGTLVSVETYGPAGWPSNLCLEDPECQEDSVVSLRERRAQVAPELIDWVVFDCPCDPAQGDLLRNCNCVGPKFAESYVNTQNRSLVAKPLRSVYVDDVLIHNGDIITKDPGTIVTMKVVVSQVPDGTKVHCIQRGAVDLTLEDEWDLIVENGTTGTKDLIAPAQGTKGVVAVSGPMIRPMTFCVRGFAGA